MCKPTEMSTTNFYRIFISVIIIKNIYIKYFLDEFINSIPLFVINEISNL